MAKSPKKVLGGLPVVKVAIVQKSPAFMDRDASLARAEAYIAEAGAEGAQLVVFPEVWLSGYPYWTEGWDSNVGDWVKERVRFRDAAIVAPSEDTERLGAAAAKAGVYLAMGCNELDGRPEVGTIYQGTVVKVVDFGAFVNFFGARDGLVHISQLAPQRVAKTTDVVNEGDKVWVKLLGFDDRGKVRLSMKVVDQETGQEIAEDAEEQAAS